jgi:hypothetical protein
VTLSCFASAVVCKLLAARSQLPQQGMGDACSMASCLYMLMMGLLLLLL